MIVDGEPVMINLVKNFLEDAGYIHFLTAHDASAAQAMLVRQRPDVLVLDILIQGRAGFDLLAAIRSSASLRYLPVLVLSSAGDADTMMRALELGATDFLAKPVNPSELSIRVRNALSLKSHSDQLEHNDSLTGLPNRQVFLQYLMWSLKLAQRRNTLCAVLQIGLDRFKQVNDTLGFEVGDQILKAVSQRILSSLRETDTVSVAQARDDETSVSRLGGDEFVVLASEIRQSDDAGIIARRMLDAMKLPLSVAGQEFFVTISVGIAIYPQDAHDSPTLLSNVAHAMAQAKLHGRNTYAFWSPIANTSSHQNLWLEAALRKNVENGVMQLEYQPQIDVGSKRIVGCEALMRWHHPELGWVPPSRFIALAEQTGLILAMGELALHRACADAAKWRHANWDLTLSVNVSALQFSRGNFLHIVQSALESSGLPPACLMLELTESFFMSDEGETAAMIGAIKNLGVGLSLDDFGVGYSSLAYLKRLPLDEIKIDKQFVDGLPYDQGSVAIVDAIVAIARGLGLNTVAEGVETQTQANFLKDHGCNRHQGYLFSRPVSFDHFLQLLTQSGSPRPLLSR